MSISEVGTLLAQYGFPGAVAIMLLLAAWAIIKWLGRRIDRFIGAHAFMCKTLARNDGKHLVAAAKCEAQHEENGRRMDRLQADVQTIKDWTQRAARPAP